MTISDVSPAECTFEANGEIEIDKLISINTTGCEVSVPAQVVNKVDYATKGSNLLLEPLVTGIKYTAAEWWMVPGDTNQKVVETCGLARRRRA